MSSVTYMNESCQHTNAAGPKFSKENCAEGTRNMSHVLYMYESFTEMNVSCRTYE